MIFDGRFLLRAIVYSIAGCCFLTGATLLPQSATEAQVKPEISSLAYFDGDWECSGKFDSSGKSIEAHLHFAPDLEGAWILFRHDDKPPFNYHALAEWGWDAARKQFVMTVQDSGGGVRMFSSQGWNSKQLQWDGDTLRGTGDPSQRFTFEKLDDRHFTVSYLVRKPEGWSRIDSSTCSRQ
jgi:hypothetical protein